MKTEFFQTDDANPFELEQARKIIHGKFPNRAGDPLNIYVSFIALCKSREQLRLLLTMLCAAWDSGAIVGPSAVVPNGNRLALFFLMREGSTFEQAAESKKVLRTMLQTAIENGFARLDQLYADPN